MNEDLAAELKAMAQEDQRIRTPPPEQEKKFAVRMSPEQMMEWSRVDVRNTDRLREIVERYGWPAARWSGRKAPTTRGCWPSTPISSSIFSVERWFCWPLPSTRAKPLIASLPISPTACA